MNFDLFWRTYLENYPFFALRGVDWAEVRRKYRPRITDRISPEEARARLDWLRAHLELFDRLELRQKTTPGMVTFTLSLLPARPLKK